MVKKPLAFLEKISKSKKQKNTTKQDIKTTRNGIYDTKWHQRSIKFYATKACWFVINLLYTN
jgi:hypothetical protein